MARKVYTISELSTLLAGKGIGFIIGLFFGIILIGLGIWCFTIPVLGWLFGIVLIFFGIGMPLGGLGAIKLDTRLKGACPRCGEPLNVYSTTKTLVCQVCKRLILVMNGKFELA